MGSNFSIKISSVCLIILLVILGYAALLGVSMRVETNVHPFSETNHPFVRNLNRFVDQHIDNDEEDMFLDSPHPKLRQEHIHKIKQSILEGLGLQKIPDTKKMNISQEEYSRTYELFVRQQEERRTQRMVDDLRTNPRMRLHPYTIQKFTVFLPEDIGVDDFQEDSITFPVNVVSNLTDAVSSLEVSDATLRLLVPGVATPEDAGEVLISVHHQLANGSLRFLDRRSVHAVHNRPRWVDFNVYSALESSLISHVDRLRIKVTCDSMAVLQQQVLAYRSKAALNTLVNLEINNSNRIKRTAHGKLNIKTKKPSRTRCENNNKRCCRHTMQVTFKELEPFDFIIEPKSYDAGFCKGRCPYRYNTAHMHAVIQSLMWRKDRSAPKPCCAPSRLETLQIIHLDDHDKLKITNWTKMAIVDCACS